MKRWLPFGIILALILTAVCCLFGTAIAPEDFTGAWYSSTDGALYMFREGIITCEKHQIPFSGDQIFSGSYSFSKDSIVVFAIGIEGLTEVQELYLIRNWKGDVLCENRDGSGEIYFYRNAEEAASREHQKG